MTHTKAHATTRNAVQTYERARDLPRLVPLWPHEIAATTPTEQARLIARLRRALRLERQRGLGGHWAYDLSRHAQLLRAYRSELADYLSKTRGGKGRDRALP